MAHSLLDVLAEAAAGGEVDLGDHAFGHAAGTDVVLALDLGWASLPPTLTERLTPPDHGALDLDADASHVLALVVVPPDEPFELDEQWGTGSAEPGHADVPDVHTGLEAPAAFHHDPWTGHDLDADHSVAHTDHHHVPVDDTDDDFDDEADDADPWDDLI